jgi:hypothetical protein
MNILKQRSTSIGTIDEAIAKGKKIIEEASK